MRSFRILFVLLALFLGSHSAEAQTIKTVFAGTPGNHEITWNTRTSYKYYVDVSLDLVNWSETGIVEPGTGSSVTYHLSSTAEKIFYRVRETNDPDEGGFLASPANLDQFRITQGVNLVFNLNLFPQLPKKLLIYTRVHGTTDDWDLIGSIDDFIERDDFSDPLVPHLIRSVRGSSIWLPDQTGTYDIKALFVNASDAITATAYRQIVVAANHAPTVTINSYTDRFATTVSDSDADHITKVDFFDNGVYIGTDYSAPNDPTHVFGNTIVGRFGGGKNGPDQLFTPLAKGHHVVTAVAYDSQGAASAPSPAKTFDITNAAYRPTLTLSSSIDGQAFSKGAIISLGYTTASETGSPSVASVAAWDYTMPLEEPIYDSSDLSQPIQIDTTHMYPGTHLLRFAARDSSDNISYFQYAKIIVYETGQGNWAQDMIAGFVDSSSVTVTNPKFSGDIRSQALFFGGISSGLQIDQGTILTTGSAAIWNKYIHRPDVSELYDPAFQAYLYPNNNPMEEGDFDLNYRVTTAITHDASALEFDISGSGNQIEFELQFGSEEYDEYIGRYTDKFMIAIDNHLATYTPNGNGTISVDTINEGKPADEYGAAIPAVNRYLFLNSDEDIEVDFANSNHKVEYDGLTERMHFYVFCKPITNHHIKAVISDVDDDVYDAAIFLKRDSLRITNPTP